MNRRDPALRRHPRRGATLVIVAISLTVILGFAALAVDLARLTNFQAELKGIADAAATSAALDLATAQTQTQATTNVTTLAGRNPIENVGTATVSEVTGVTWDFTTNAVTATPVWSSANAVRVVTRYTMGWTLARIFGQGSSRALADTSIAAYGQRRTHDCLKPFVLPYSAIRTRLSLTPTDTTSLTAANIYALRSQTSPIKYDVLDTVNVAATTSFGWVNTRQGTTGSASDVAIALSSCVSGTLGAGSTLQARPKFGDTTSIQNAAVTACGGAANCTASNRILVPIYTSGTNANGTSTTTSTTTAAANQSVTLTVDNGCYKASNSNSYNQQKCSAFVATLTQASNSAPAYITTNGTTYACKTGPTYTGLGSSGNGNGNSSKTTYYLYFQYSNCFTTTTTTTGTARSAATYVIKYIATFVWTARTNTSITGYFTTLNYPPESAVTWDPLPGPVTSVILVR